MTELATAWMLGCSTGFFLGVTVAGRGRPASLSITFPTPPPSRQPRNPYTGEPVQPNQPPQT